MGNTLCNLCEIADFFVSLQRKERLWRACGALVADGVLIMLIAVWSKKRRDY